MAFLVAQIRGHPTNHFGGKLFGETKSVYVIPSEKCHLELS